MQERDTNNMNNTIENRKLEKGVNMLRCCYSTTRAGQGGSPGEPGRGADPVLGLPAGGDAAFQEEPGRPGRERTPALSPRPARHPPRPPPPPPPRPLAPPPPPALPARPSLRLPPGRAVDAARHAADGGLPGSLPAWDRRWKYLAADRPSTESGVLG